MKRSAGEPIAVQAVLIDLDGTLVDSAPDIAAAVNRTLAELGRGTRDEGIIRNWIGGGGAALMGRALTACDGVPPADLLLGHAVDRFVAHYTAEVCVRSRPFPGVENVLPGLLDSGFRVACVTNKSRVLTTTLLETLGLDRWFHGIVAGDSLPHRKPHPLPLLHACESLGVAPGEAVMVGDTDTDLQAARAAGMPSIYAQYGYNPGVDIEPWMPVAHLSAFPDLERLLVFRESMQTPVDSDPVARLT